jgi:tRNA nucleotidyltransferase (CCA-adding enzyme)
MGWSEDMRADQVIATHGNTDFDAFASMVAARRLYPQAVICLTGSLNRNVREFYRLHADELNAVEASRLETDAIRRLIVVETSTAARLGELEPVALDPTVEKVVFDHHDARPDWASPDSVVLARDGALTTTLVSILAERELVVTPLEATVFALGIHEDTGSLTYPSATQRDAEALAWCLRHGASQELLADFLHLPLLEGERRLLNAVLDAIEPVETAGIEVLVAAVAWPEYVDAVSTLAHKLMELTDARALALLIEMDARVFCVTRSRTPDLHAGELAAALGGGGHEGAASAIVRGSLEDARLRLLAGLEDAVRRPPTARDLMSTPPRWIAPEETVARAMVLCQRHRQSGILVADQRHVVGVAAREDLDKAIGHGLSHAPVKAVMSPRPVTCDEDTPLRELQHLLAAAPGGRVGVVRDEEIVGVVTRSDLVRALGTETDVGGPAEGSLAEELRALPRLVPVWEAVAALSEGYDGVYLVGGTVRDILLGEQSFDVDIAVEGDAIAIARALADALGGRVRPHEKFGTAVVLYGEGERVDVVTARTEFYDAPAALPTVEHASIREDLFRRDFTINAMAASLRGEDFGRLVDPFGGRRDLAAGTIRVLHNLSFIDDPTRIFRALRYKARYGFSMDEHTRRLARGCIEMGLVGDLSSARLRDELMALLDEPGAPDALVRLGELAVDRAIHPDLRADEEAAALLRRAIELRATYDVDVPGWRLGLAVLARRLSSDEVLSWLDRLKVRRRDAERVAAAVTVAPRIVERLRARGAGDDPAGVFALADPYAPDAPLLALALDDLEPLHEYFRGLRNVRLEITGADLAALGLAESPRVGEILGELRRRKLNGDLDGRDSELAAARELIRTS